jgi:hypothetical protein
MAVMLGYAVLHQTDNEGYWIRGSCRRIEIYGCDVGLRCASPNLQ